MGDKPARFDATDYLNTEEDIVAYLRAASEDGDPDLIAAALDDAAKARKRLAAKSGVTMKEVSFNEWAEFISARARAADPPGQLSNFREVGDDGMEYVLDGKVIARSEGYTKSRRRYYVEDDSATVRQE